METAYTGADALAAGQAISQHYMIEFVRIGRGGLPLQDTVSLGSGTLVELAGVRGIVTAAHVLKALQEQDHVGIVRFGGGLNNQRLRLSVELLDSVAIGGEEAGEAGPDIAFIRLPPEETLASTNVFYSPEAHSAAIDRRSADYGDSQLRFAMGVLETETRQLHGRMDGAERASLSSVPSARSTTLSHWMATTASCSGSPMLPKPDRRQATAA